MVEVELEYFQVLPEVVFPNASEDSQPGLQEAFRLNCGAFSMVLSCLVFSKFAISTEGLLLRCHLSIFEFL
ncbi:hypothetical protein AKJ65_08065 [candidate division MSBL1 archaeon SCGC-AAA259E19]|uniref:Uncharacterized protein n=1 Tax=candidate division MSBL1 archaeon SCGC-AAA259E19 TaxID=1698264 RepID=A0A133UD37_9EURY|nr:hypothetical protein AKJ65_08065 [candidate division MSBL1 archaeon SCGC-AAA259E19]